MSVYTYWDEQSKHILRTDIVGEWTWEAYLDSMYRFVSNHNESGRIDHIIDLRHSQHFPTQGAINQLRRIAEKRLTDSGITIIVGANGFVKSLLDVFAQIYGAPFPINHAVETMDDAYALVKQQYHAETA